MNSLSVVLAADSASTVKHYGENGEETRYFKGANKIFQLSNSSPIGVMIYNSASLLGVPWEVTVKEFRKEIADKTFNNVKGFAEEFFSYIQDNVTFFPEEIRKTKFVDDAQSLAILAMLNIKKGKENGGNDRDLKENFLGSRPALSFDIVSEEEVQTLKTSVFDDIRDEVEKYFKDSGIEISDQLDDFTEVIFDHTLNSTLTGADYTGFVFAGFGDHSVFPEVVSFKKCKFVGTKFISAGCEETRISYDKPASIHSFAQTSMTDTFQLGMSEEVFSKLYSVVAEQFQLALDDIVAKNANALDGIDGTDLIKARIGEVRDHMLNYMLEDHSAPLRRVLGSLPVDEMAELAETLINLQSLKEKVTKPSETVGGPVDVAAITRSEGLVWIKRKHYFEADINSRYFSRQV